MGFQYTWHALHKEEQFNGVSYQTTYQQNGWKSVNLAHPFSSGVAVSGAGASHTLEPTSKATQGEGGLEFTCSSNTAVHPVSKIKNKVK